MPSLPIATRRLALSAKTFAPLTSSQFASSSRSHPFLTRVYDAQHVQNLRNGGQNGSSNGEYRSGAASMAAAGMGVKSFYVNKDDDDDHEKSDPVAVDDECLSPRSALRRRLSREVTLKKYYLNKIFRYATR